MTTITITYDANDSFAQKTIEYMFSLGIFQIVNLETDNALANSGV